MCRGQKFATLNIRDFERFEDFDLKPERVATVS